MSKDIFQYIKEQEIQYAQDIEVMENWSWNMKEHIRISMLMKHGKFVKATNDLETKNPNRNIVYPLLNLRYRAEDIDLRDVVLYVNDSKKYHLSFLVKKYHDEIYVREHDLDTFFDEIKEEKIDFGGTLVRKTKDGFVSEPLESIAFCDQTDILSGPIGFKMFFSPDELYEMESMGWGKKENGADVTLEELVTLADESKQQDSQKGLKTKTPGKYIEIYRVHGSLPSQWIYGSSKEKYIRQIYIVGFYKNSEGIDTGVTLYKKQEYENPFKVHLSGKKIRNRALSYGGVEELFDPQIWTNYSEIQKKNMLDAASKIILQTTDEGYTNRNQIKDMDNLEITVTREGSRIDQVPTHAPNIQLFNEWIQEWNIQGQTTSGATDALLGKNPSAGSPFRLQALVVDQGQGLHAYRRGKFAKFIEEIYNDGIIPSIVREITNGVTFLATLSQDEMEFVSDSVSQSMANKYAVEKVLNGEIITNEEVDVYKQRVKQDFSKSGNKKFIEILKDEFKNVPLSIKVNVAGKQKDLAGIVEKMTNIFRQVFVNPQILDNPKAAKVFNKLIEYSGMDPIDFGYATSKPVEALSAPSPVQVPNNQPQLA